MQNIWGLAEFLEKTVVSFLALLITVRRFTVVIAMVALLPQRQNAFRNYDLVASGSDR
jgi:hypothetical protein